MKSLKNFLVALIIGIAACNTYAAEVNPNGMIQKCTVSDSWRGPDKTKHAIAGAAIGSWGTMVFKEPKYGVLATALVAGVKEAYDRRGYGTCSLQDFAVTVAAGTAAAYGTKWLIGVSPDTKSAFVGYNFELK